MALQARQGVKFHNGVPFNAEIVAWNLTTQSDQKMLAYATLGQKVSPKVVDSYTIDVSTETPDPILPLRLRSVMMGEPKAIEADPQGKNMIGTGAYKLDQWIPGQRIVLVSNPDYWGGEPPIKKATFVWRTESSVRTAMLRAGEAISPPG